MIVQAPFAWPPAGQLLADTLCRHLLLGLRLGGCLPTPCAGSPWCTRGSLLSPVGPTWAALWDTQSEQKFVPIILGTAWAQIESNCGLSDPRVGHYFVRPPLGH